MTNEQNATQLEGYLVELNAAIDECDIVNNGEGDFFNLAARLQRDIDSLRNIKPVFGN